MRSRKCYGELSKYGKDAWSVYHSDSITPMHTRFRRRSIDFQAKEGDFAARGGGAGDGRLRTMTQTTHKQTSFCRTTKMVALP
jgi:hypothetical protein